MPLEAADLANHEVIKAIQTSLADVGKLVRGMVTIQHQQNAVINDLRVKQAAIPVKSEKDGKDDDEGEDDDVDVDSLDNKSFQKMIMKNIGGMLDERLGQFGTKLDSVSTEYRNGRLTEEYVKLKSDHKDFDEWSDEMKALAKDNPTLTLKRLYTLARSENADKTKEMDTKYAPKDDVKEKADGGLTLFGGFRPTIGKTGDGGESGKNGKKMTPAEAGSQAWEETVAKFPGLKSLETNPLD